MARVLLAVSLACGAGCTTPPDWIARTLVTVDVTGNWYGASLARSGGAYIAPEIWLDLRQEGPKVTGSMRSRGMRGGIGTTGGPVPIEGSIAGDVFSFRRADGSGTGELRVQGDEMIGEVTIGDSVPVTVRRVER